MTEPTSADILEVLREVVDPEIGMNIVDLGLVYKANVVDGHVRVTLTMRICHPYPLRRLGVIP